MGVVVLIAVLGALPFALTQRAPFGLALPELASVNLTLVFMLGALSLNFLTGSAGVVSLAHAALFATGAMTAAVIGGHFGWPFPVALAAATLAGALVGLVAALPALQARGVYLLLSTFALHHVVLYALPQLKLSVFGAADYSYSPPALGPFAIDTPLRWYFLLLAIVALVYLALRNILRGREGLATMAMRDHEFGASALGADPRLLTIKAFAISSGIAGLAGALYVYLAPGAAPERFGLDFAIAFIAMIVIGGLGSPTGALIGAALWRLAPPLVSALDTRVGETTSSGAWIAAHQPSIIAATFGLATIAVLLFAPTGLAGFGRSSSGVREP